MNKLTFERKKRSSLSFRGGRQGLSFLGRIGRIDHIGRMSRIGRFFRPASIIMISFLVLGAGVWLLAKPKTSNASFATIEITDSAGTPLAGFIISDKLYVTVNDANRNTDSGTAEKIELTVTTTGAGDSETLTVANGRALVETGKNTGVFRNPGLTTQVYDGAVAADDGVLEIKLADSIKATYADTTTESQKFDFADSPLPHAAYEAGHADDGSAADDPTATSCGDTKVYAGTFTAANINDATKGEYLPTDRADFDIQPGSKAGINDGPNITANIKADDGTYESNKSITGGLSAPTFSTGCHGWSIHDFEFDVTPFSSANLTGFDLDWRGVGTWTTALAGEAQTENDLVMLLLNRTTNKWEVADTTADAATTDSSGPPFADLSLSKTISTGFTDYLDANNKVRFAVAEYSLTTDTSPQGGLYTDYVSVTANGQDTISDTLTIGNGTIKGKVWDDTDKDGTLDAGEKGLKNVKVTLLDSTKTPLAFDLTDSNGDFLFDGIPADTYQLSETDPDGYVSTTVNDITGIILNQDQTIDNQNFGDVKELSTTGLTLNYTLGSAAILFALALLGWFIIERTHKRTKKSLVKIKN